MPLALPFKPRLLFQRPPLQIALALLMLLALLQAGLRLFGPSGKLVSVERKTWRLEIDVERRLEELGSSWCAEMPADATELSRRLMPDPQHPEQPAAEHCKYRAPGWRTSWRAQSTGTAPQVPQWPQPPLRVEPLGGITNGPTPLGIERLGERYEFYELELAHADGQTWTCRLPRTRWEAVPLGLRFRLPVDRYGVANCAGLITSNPAPA
ncbi:hypothetical protein [Paucibacter sp. Y2R2-4]|uniref:hypothetical protein n=1 Tax=Paucibacter sp. Y2R2-4 TaxID=2893553 RepID=UPI0021E506AD|nr:hypothetical protein [Paucibacter sp. Y2R2-4]MCV2349606.1 hypothetical protein [Paucibacter sp. Y2R2-4]